MERVSAFVYRVPGQLASQLASDSLSADGEKRSLPKTVGPDSLFLRVLSLACKSTVWTTFKFLSLRFWVFFFFVQRTDRLIVLWL